MNIESYILEDLGFGDITSDALIDDSLTGTAAIIANEPCVVAGICETEAVFQYFNIKTNALVSDGQSVEKGDIILEVSGSLKSILSAERTALNFLMRMSGIATVTHSISSKLSHAKVAATRKTTPGFRSFEKKAVILGGGDPHRFCLDDLILIKDNHIAVVGGVAEAVIKAKKFSFAKKVEVEVESIEDAEAAVKSEADIILLDNMSPEKAAKCYSLIKSLNSKIIVEVSGTITPETAPLHDECSDIISLGWITHSVRSIQFSLDVC